MGYSRHFSFSTDAAASKKLTPQVTTVPHIDTTVVSLCGLPKNLEEKDGQTQLLCYVSIIRACNKVL